MKRKKDEANTVGASTLRVEHIKFSPPNTVIFDFLGKDSVRYFKKIKVPPTIYKNFKLFVKDKKKIMQNYLVISIVWLSMIICILLIKISLPRYLELD